MNVVKTNTLLKLQPTDFSLVYMSFLTIMQRFMPCPMDIHGLPNLQWKIGLFVDISILQILQAIYNLVYNILLKFLFNDWLVVENTYDLRLCNFSHMLYPHAIA